MDHPQSTPAERLCKACGQTYPRTPEYWTRQNSSPDGLTYKCRDCYNAHAREYGKRRRRINQEEVTVEERRCPECKETKPANEFNKDRRKISGLGVYCKSCARTLGLMRYHTRYRPQRIAQYQKVRMAVLHHYGGEKPCCACCGESIIEFLALDHVNDDGAERRRQHGNNVGEWKWIIANDYPEGYRLLCHNCHTARHRYGLCPHQRLPGAGE